MFEQSMLANKVGRSPWAFLASMVLQCAAVGTLILVPLMYMEAAPPAVTILSHGLEVPPGPRPQQPAPERRPAAAERRSSLLPHTVVLTPRFIPATIDTRPDPTVALPEISSTAAWLVPGGTGADRGIPGGLGNASVTPPPPPPVKLPSPTTRVNVGGDVQQAKLINAVRPQFPPLARQARISGAVRLAAVISEVGAIEELRVVAGHPLLVQAAVDAVRQWRYRPTLLNGQPVKVETTIEVNFTLQQ